ncbi:MAG: hypothetical protein ABI547_05135 [Betaproteobacteria bacterium]
MAEPGVLTLAYVSAHPTDAARVLAGVPAAEAAALFAGLPARAAAPALAAMLPPRAARLLGVLDDDRALALLTAAGALGAVTILRHIPEPRRSYLLNGLSTTTAVASRLLLGYPEDTVGAWADPEILAFAPATSAGDALARARADPDAEASEVYVVAADGRLKGVVALPNLLRAPDITALAALMEPSPAMLQAAMPLSGALAHPAWQRTSVLPVVERDARLIGVLRAAKLHEAFALGSEVRKSESETTLAGLAAASYWDAVSGLVRSGLALLPPVKRVLPDER